jgi:hypothetical protein
VGEYDNGVAIQHVEEAEIRPADVAVNGRRKREHRP